MFGATDGVCCSVKGPLVVLPWVLFTLTMPGTVLTRATVSLWRPPSGQDEPGDALGGSVR